MSAAAGRRVLTWDGCVNVRDLGGLPTVDGETTRFGAVVRADSIRGLSEAGWRALAEYGVRTAIDLRGEDECERDASGEVPVEVLRFPISPRKSKVAWRFPSMLEGYLGMLETFAERFAGVVAAVGRAEQAVVVHCAGGRDRTGLASALLLRLAGVDPDTIAADHGLSDEIYAPTVDDWLAEAPDEEERERRRRIAAPAGRTMAAVLAELERRHGSVEAYLLRGGAAEDDLVRARGRLCGQP